MILSFVEVTTVVYLLHAWVTLSLRMRKECVYSHISDLSEFWKVVPLGTPEAFGTPPPGRDIPLSTCEIIERIYIDICSRFLARSSFLKLL